MPSVPISKFKAQCLAMLERVRKTGEPLRVTRFGRPLVDIMPASVSAPPNWLGLMASSGEIVGDIVTPIAGEADWEALADSRARTAARVSRKQPR